MFKGYKSLLSISSDRDFSNSDADLTRTLSSERTHNYETAATKERAVDRRLGLGIGLGLRLGTGAGSGSSLDSGDLTLAFTENFEFHTESQSTSTSGADDYPSPDSGNGRYFLYDPYDTDEEGDGEAPGPPGDLEEPKQEQEEHPVEQPNLEQGAESGQGILIACKGVELRNVGVAHCYHFNATVREVIFPTSFFSGQLQAL
jgi:hypothetical protein